MDKLETILRQKGYSLTRPRRLVFETLRSNKLMSNTQLTVAATAMIDRASVYRTIALFEKLGIVQRVWRGFKSQIELSDIFSHHHHHLTCNRCGRVLTIENKALETLLDTTARLYKFKLGEHHVELSGLSENCQ